MTVEFKGSFLKDLKKIKDAAVLSRLAAAIVAVEAAESLGDITSCKKLQGSDDYYRIRVGDFRVGLSVEDDVVKFVRFQSRRYLQAFSLSAFSRAPPIGARHQTGDA